MSALDSSEASHEVNMDGGAFPRYSQIHACFVKFHLYGLCREGLPI